MLDSKANAVQKDVKNLIDDANGFLYEAGVSTGAAAAELRNKGITNLKNALAKVEDTRASTIAAGKEFSQQTDTYVQKNPWKAVSISGGIGLLLGVLLASK